MASPKAFALHPRLVADCHQLGRLPQCRLLLHRNPLIPWLILVPEVAVEELFAIPHPQRTRIQGEWDRLARFVHRHFDCDRINMAAIGNLVPQLHLHVVGRRVDDPCWPGVVWGRLPQGSQWPDRELQALVGALEKELGLRTG
ncbi:MAG: HIT family protein [Candidatus Competibacteraceae bacterium]|nr:HIT family protein [Candidatus Competibacteraceae bacterium]